MKDGPSRATDPQSTNCKTPVSSGRSEEKQTPSSSSGLSLSLIDDAPRTNNNNTSSRGNSKSSSAKASGKDRFTSRYDSSLGLLTKKFVQLLQDAPKGVLDLNIAASALGVQKRRIYDITNVLEGIDLIEKRSKNHIAWSGDNDTKPMDNSSDNPSRQFGAGGSLPRQSRSMIKSEISMLERDERRLDEFIHMASSMLRRYTDEKPSYHDYTASQGPLSSSRNNLLRYLRVSIHDMKDIVGVDRDTVVAIKAPAGTSLEVPDPDDGIVGTGKRKYQIFLNSGSTGQPINIRPVKNCAAAQSNIVTESGFWVLSSSSNNIYPKNNTTCSHLPRRTEQVIGNRYKVPLHRSSSVGVIPADYEHRQHRSSTLSSSQYLPPNDYGNRNRFEADMLPPPRASKSNPFLTCTNVAENSDRKNNPKIVENYSNSPLNEPLPPPNLGRRVATYKNFSPRPQQPMFYPSKSPHFSSGNMKGSNESSGHSSSHSRWDKYNNIPASVSAEDYHVRRSPKKNRSQKQLSRSQWSMELPNTAASTILTPPSNQFHERSPESSGSNSLGTPPQNFPTASGMVVSYNHHRDTNSMGGGFANSINTYQPYSVSASAKEMLSIPHMRPVSMLENSSYASPVESSSSSNDDNRYGDFFDSPLFSPRSQYPMHSASNRHFVDSSQIHLDQQKSMLSPFTGDLQQHHDHQQQQQQYHQRDYFSRTHSNDRTSIARDRKSAANNFSSMTRINYASRYTDVQEKKDHKDFETYR